MKETVFWAELPWPVIEARVERNATVFLPIGATEQHGRHMSVDVDVVIPTEICARAAVQIDGLVLPTVPYGNRSQPKTGGGPDFSGTLNLTANTFSLLLKEILCELRRHKVRNVVVLNGHYENIWPSIEGIELAYDHLGRGASVMTVLRVDHWDLIKQSTLDRIFPDGYPGIELEHASVLETSMMMAIKPDRVTLSDASHDGPARFRPYDRFPKPLEDVPASGVLSMTEGSSAEKGEWLLSDIVTGLVEITKAEFSSRQPTKT